MKTGAKSSFVAAAPNPSLERTSTGMDLAREAPGFIIRLPGHAGGGPLSSNVRRRYNERSTR